HGHLPVVLLGELHQLLGHVVQVGVGRQVVGGHSSAASSVAASSDAANVSAGLTLTKPRASLTPQSRRATTRQTEASDVNATSADTAAVASCRTATPIGAGPPTNASLVFIGGVCHSASP